MEWMSRGAVLAVALWGVGGCGGGGGDNPAVGGPPGGGSNAPGGYTPGVYAASSSLANQCSTPMAQSMFLRSWTNETYLWYSEVPDTNPTGFTTADYFERLKTPLTTATGNDKDRFHFTYSTADWQALSQQSIQVGYGAQWVLVPRANANPQVMTAFVESGYTAAQQGVVRGTEVMAADGIVVANIRTDAQVDQLYAALYPAAANEQHTFTLRDANGAQREITMTSASVTYSAVPTWSVINQADGPVGYLLFNDHVAPAERELFDAIDGLRNAGVKDLVLDLRYNGGGYLAIANELAYMIANTTRTAGRTFERLIFNNKFTTIDPAGQPIEPTPFYSTAKGFTVPSGTPLPSLNLERVYVITGNNTCSASESIINSLRGIDVQVYQIGETTCGKPYGFYPEDNCGTTYFSIQFEGRNAKDFGNYPDGFVPGSADSGSTIRGCRVADDFTNELGDPLEARLQIALGFRASNNQICPAVVSAAPDGSSSKPAVARSWEGKMIKSPARENRIVERPRTGIAF
ncbi:S41 family peptidase [Peristeroidobacter agariperforans]|uniref:S41 family peptidase n=1 Tax=Peristeroidobacter agariperforans TaxID=268404 RepID=UPI00101DA3E2|nr:S41 family peptidase [Peristeroidobacter agariperforans]